MRRRPISLRIARVAAGLSLKEVGQRAAINSPRLGRIEKGVIVPTTEELRRILEALGPDVAAAIPAAQRFIRTTRKVRPKAPGPEAA